MVESKELISNPSSNQNEIPFFLSKDSIHLYSSGELPVNDEEIFAAIFESINANLEQISKNLRLKACFYLQGDIFYRLFNIDYLSGLNIFNFSKEFNIDNKKIENQIISELETFEGNIKPIQEKMQEINDLRIEFKHNHLRPDEINNEILLDKNIMFNSNFLNVVKNTLFHLISKDSNNLKKNYDKIILVFEYNNKIINFFASDNYFKIINKDFMNNYDLITSLSNNIEKKIITNIYKKLVFEPALKRLLKNIPTAKVATASAINVSNFYSIIQVLDDNFVVPERKEIVEDSIKKFNNYFEDFINNELNIILNNFDKKEIYKELQQLIIESKQYTKFQEFKNFKVEQSINSIFENFYDKLEEKIKKSVEKFTKDSARFDINPILINSSAMIEFKLFLNNLYSEKILIKLFNPVNFQEVIGIKDFKIRDLQNIFNLLAKVNIGTLTTEGLIKQRETSELLHSEEFVNVKKYTNNFLPFDLEIKKKLFKYDNKEFAFFIDKNHFLAFFTNGNRFSHQANNAFVLTGFNEFSDLEFNRFVGRYSKRMIRKIKENYSDFFESQGKGIHPFFIVSKNRTRDLNSDENGAARAGYIYELINKEDFKISDYKMMHKSLILDIKDLIKNLELSIPEKYYLTEEEIEKHIKNLINDLNKGKNVFTEFKKICKIFNLEFKEDDVDIVPFLRDIERINPNKLSKLFMITLVFLKEQFKSYQKDVWDIFQRYVAEYGNISNLNKRIEKLNKNISNIDNLINNKFENEIEFINEFFNIYLNEEDIVLKYFTLYIMNLLYNGRRIKYVKEEHYNVMLNNAEYAAVKLGQEMSKLSIEERLKKIKE